MAGLLEDLVALGDGGWWLERVLTPIFYVMSYEVSRRMTLLVTEDRQCPVSTPQH
jgi:hypothetical protein